MMAFPAMLTPAAEKAGMKVPEDPDDFDHNKYPHFNVFCIVQLGRPMLSPGEHWENAEIIAKIPDDEIRLVTLPDLMALGLHFTS